jgi:hypothetical protein
MRKSPLIYIEHRCAAMELAFVVPFQGVVIEKGE